MGKEGKRRFHLLQGSGLSPNTPENKAVASAVVVVRPRTPEALAEEATPKVECHSTTQVTNIL